MNNAVKILKEKGIKTTTFHIIETKFGIMLGINEHTPFFIENINEALEIIKNHFIESEN